VYINSSFYLYLTGELPWSHFKLAAVTQRSYGISGAGISRPLCYWYQSTFHWCV